MNFWETFHHEADVGVRGRAATLEEAFAQAALALTAVVTDPARVRCRDVIALRCEAPDAELLFVDWINSLIYEMATRKLLFADYTVRIDGGRLEASACGEAVDNTRHAPAVEVKGATYTELKVRREADGQWLAQCVVDV
jgi:SHS2 domain-containing protein